MKYICAIWTVWMAIVPLQGQPLAPELPYPPLPAGFTKGLAEAIHAGPREATLLVSGVPLTGNSGDDTTSGIDFSGVYEAAREGGSWKLGRQIPLDRLGRIAAQRLTVSLRPGYGIDVEDRMRVAVTTGNGFVARLNHRAKLMPVRQGEAEVRSRFGGGLLWVNLPPGEAEITLRYSLEVETAPKDANSGRFTADYGHIRNQYLWHPLFGFGNEGDQADFQVEVRAPRDCELTTSLPQTTRIQGEERIVEGRSVQRTFALTLAYDRGWKVQNEKAGSVRLELFVTPEFRPDAAAMVEEFRQVHDLLAGRFGEPESGYVAVVQLRAARGNGWHFNSNQGVFADGSPGFSSRKEPVPAAHLGHEIGHFWTKGSGPVANFLREGWATYVESLVLEREYGRDTAILFWKQHARAYFDQYDGRAAMWDSGNGSNLNYDKGGWVFRMLEDAVGAEAFGKAMAEFSRRSLSGSAGWETLAECLDRQKAPGFDAAQFLMPWFKERRVPRLSARIEGRNVTITQEGSIFLLPVTIEGTTARGTERHRVWLGGSSTGVEFSGEVSQVRIDPDEMLLLRR